MTAMPVRWTVYLNKSEASNRIYTIRCSDIFVGSERYASSGYTVQEDRRNVKSLPVKRRTNKVNNCRRAALRARG